MISQTRLRHNRISRAQANALLYSMLTLIAVIVLYTTHRSHAANHKRHHLWPQAIQERYGFESGTEGWKPTRDEGSSAIRSGAQSPARSYAGNYSLRLELDLRGSHAILSKGEVFVDMRNYPPYGVPIPVDLTGREISIFVWLPIGSRGPDSSPNGLQVFSKDVNFKSEYGAWENIQENTWMQVKLAPSTSAPSGGAMDAGFDPKQIRIIGLKIGTAEDSTDSYQGEFYIDSVSFGAPTAPRPAALNERYGFEQSDEGFVVSGDPQFQAITSQGRDTTQAANGTASNRLTIKLDGDDPTRKAGEVYVDMLKAPPFRVDIPIDLEGKEVGVYVFCPPGARGDGESPNALQLFAKDDRWRSEYGSWTPIVEGYWMKITLTPSMIAPPGGYKDDGFDPKRIRTLGIKITAGARSSKYGGMIFMDSFSFPAELVPLQNLKYGFEPDKQGWQNATHSSLPAVTSVGQSSDVVLEGSKALRLNLNATPGDGRACGAAEVDMLHFPPPEVRAPFNLEGQAVEAYVYCPTGSQSQNSQRPNQLRLFVKDDNFKSEYGTPTTMLNGQWVRLKLEPSKITPPDGYKDDGFDPSKVRTIGIEICMTGAYNGPVYIDHISFPATPAAPLMTDHGYNFNDPGGEEDFPRWGTDPSWNAKAWTTVFRADGALAADAQFQPGKEETRKGVFVIQFNPALNLSRKDHQKIQAKLKFQPHLEGLLCFSAKISVHDKDKDRWYDSQDIAVGASGWNIIQFDLADPTKYSAKTPGPMSSFADIGAVAIQIFANCPYTGRVLLDDVAVGGKEKPGYYIQLTVNPVERDGTRFTLDGKDFYFAGANAEYLFNRSDGAVAQVLALAKDMDLRVVRAWAFHEGQDYSFQPAQGRWNEMAFEHLDRIVAEAGRLDIRLMLALVDNWGHNGGMYKYVDWLVERKGEKEYLDSLSPELAGELSKPESERTSCFSHIYHDEFYVNRFTRQWYKNYVRKLLERRNTITGRLYKDDPTIMAWEIVNEPRCETGPGGKRIHEWIREMSDFVRGLDARQLIACGEEGGYITTIEEAGKRAFQSFPENYWQYGLNWKLGQCPTGAAGADFISDHSSRNTEVRWQSGTHDEPGPIQSEIRAGCPNIDFCAFRLYVDRREYNLHRTDHNGYDQRKEWMNEHRRDAHQVIGKPVVLEEFGIKTSGWTYNGAFGEIQLPREPEYTQADRVKIFEDYFAHIETTGINGSLFWNLGYPRMYETLFHDCETVGNWTRDVNSDAAGLTVDNSFFAQGERSLKLSFDPARANGKAVWDLNNLSEKWVVRVNDGLPTGINRTRCAVQVANPGGPVKIALAVSTGPQLLWHESQPHTLIGGLNKWNKVSFDLSSRVWKSAATNWQFNGEIKNLEDVRKVSVILYDYPAASSIYIDDITISRDDGFVIYPDDPAVGTIRAHGKRMKAK